MENVVWMCGQHGAFYCSSSPVRALAHPSEAMLGAQSRGTVAELQLHTWRAGGRWGVGGGGPIKQQVSRAAYGRQDPGQTHELTRCRAGPEGNHTAGNASLDFKIPPNSETLSFYLLQTH